MNRHFFSALAVTTGLALLSGAAAASDADHGKTLYEASCFKCHDTSIHTRPDRIIFSKRALHNRVAFCDAQAGSGWSPTDIEDVTEYLNNAFYKFDE